MRTRTHFDPRRLRGLLRAAGLFAVVSLITTAAQAGPVVTPYVPGLSMGTGMAYHPPTSTSTTSRPAPARCRR